MVMWSGGATISGAWEVEQSPLAEYYPVDSPAGKAGFDQVDIEGIGVDFHQSLPVKDRRENRVLLIGAGVGILDFDMDGMNDVLLLSGMGSNQLFRNLGEWKFEMVFDAGGLALNDSVSCGVSVVDVNGDTWPDVIVSTLDAGPVLFINNEGRGFSRSSSSGLVQQPGATTGIVADIDKDGDYDYYQCHYRFKSIKDEMYHVRGLAQGPSGNWIVPESLERRLASTRNLSGQPMLLERGRPDMLYINDGAGHFTPLSNEMVYQFNGRPSPVVDDGYIADWSLSAAFHDFNLDGMPDIYTCSDFLSPDRFWTHVGNNQYREMTWPFLPRTSYSSMDSAWGDLDNDGDEDFFVVDMLGRSREDRMRQRANMGPNVWMEWANGLNEQVMRNCLYRNRGDGSFAEVAWMAGVAASDWSWTTHFEDVDLDGLLDIVVGNGTAHDVQDVDAQNAIMQYQRARTGQVSQPAPYQFPPLHNTNILWKNLGGFQFQDMSDEWGFNAQSFSQSMAFGDLDGDGDRDYVINNFDGVPDFGVNKSQSPRVVLELTGTSVPATCDFFQVVLEAGGMSQTRIVRVGGGYLSQSGREVVFACPENGGHLKIIDPKTGNEAFRYQVDPGTRLRITPSSCITQPDPESKPSVDPKPNLPAFEKLFIAPEKAVQFFAPDRIPEAYWSDRVVEEYEAGDFQVPRYGDVFLDPFGMETRYIQPGESGGFEVYQLHRAEGRDLVWSGRKIGSGYSWPSAPLGMKIIDSSENGGVNEHSQQGVICLVFGVHVRASMHEPVSSWIEFVRVGVVDEGDVIPMASFNWEGQVPGTIAVSPDSRHCFMGGRAGNLSYENSGGGIIFKNLQNGGWEYLQGPSSAIDAEAPITGAVMHHPAPGITDIILARHRGRIEAFRLGDNGLVKDVTNEVGLGDCPTGLWLSLSMASTGEPNTMILAAGNAGANSRYNEHDDLVWVTASLPGEHYLCLPASGREKPQLMIDRDSLSEILPALPRYFPTHTGYAKASIFDLVSAFGDDTIKIHAIENVESLETRFYQVVTGESRKGYYHFEEIHGASELQEGPVRQFMALPETIQASLVSRWGTTYLLGQNFSKMKMDVEAFDGGAGGVYSVSDQRLEYVSPYHSGVRLFDDVEWMIPWRIPRDGGSGSEDAVMVIRGHLPPVMYRIR